jgi:hypothetical protein
MLLGLLALVRAVVELAEAAVAVGDEGTHAQALGQSESLTFELFGSLEVGRILMRGRLATPV